jgi:hypothetical protein
MCLSANESVRMSSSRCECEATGKPAVRDGGLRESKEAPLLNGKTGRTETRNSTVKLTRETVPTAVGGSWDGSKGDGLSYIPSGIIWQYFETVLPSNLSTSNVALSFLPDFICITVDSCHTPCCIIQLKLEDYCLN